MRSYKQSKHLHRAALWQRQKNADHVSQNKTSEDQKRQNEKFHFNHMYDCSFEEALGAE